MTKDEARLILSNSHKGNWIATDKNGDPDWSDSLKWIVLDGEFSRDELLAILAFYPE